MCPAELEGDSAEVCCLSQMQPLSWCAVKPTATLLLMYSWDLAPGVLLFLLLLDLFSFPPDFSLYLFSLTALLSFLLSHH